MAWCLQAACRYLSRSWPGSLSLYGVTGPQRVQSYWMCHLFVGDRLWTRCAIVWGVQGSILSPRMMTSSNGNIFCVTRPLCREFNGHRWIPLTKTSNAELWCWNGWINNRDAGDLRRHCAHYYVTVMGRFRSDLGCAPVVARHSPFQLTRPPYKNIWRPSISRYWYRTFQQSYAHSLVHFVFWLPDDIFQCIFFNEKFEFQVKFNWSLFLRVQLTIF